MEDEFQRPKDRPQRAALCEVHGLRFDPALQGCALCRRTPPVEPKKSRIPILAAVVLIAGFSLLAGHWLLNDDAPGPEPPGAAEGVQDPGELVEATDPVDHLVQVTSPRLDPDRYRSEISTIEAILYKPSAPGFEDISAAVGAARSLAETIRNTERAPDRKRLAQEVEFWGARIDGAMDVGYGPPDLERARSDWENVREQVFAPAHWFKTTDQALVASQQPALPQADPRTVRMLQGVAADLRRLIDVGQRETAAIGEILGEVETPEVRSIRRNWDTWSREWGERVDGVASGLPGQPSMSSPLDLVMAYQELGKALNELRLVRQTANETGVPFQYERSRRFEAADRALESARTYLSHLPRAASP